GRLADSQSFPRRAQFTEPHVRAGATHFVDLWLNHRMIPTFVDRGAQPGGDWFRTGRAGMKVEGPWLISTLRADNFGFAWDVASVSSGPEGNTTQVNLNNIQMLKEGANKEAAWEFVKFVALDEVNAARFAALTGRPPAL